MGEYTTISWADASVNFWWGCTEVSPGCDHCYARTLARRRRVGWGPQAERVKIEGAPHLVCRLRRKAQREGRRLRVFANSMSDFFDAKAPVAWRSDAWLDIACSPELDFLILTKRPLSSPSMLPKDWGDGYPNVWFGTSVETPNYLHRLDELLRVPAALHFASCEPLLAPLDIASYLTPRISPVTRRSSHLNWVIVGGESGPGHRRMDVGWLEQIVGDCRAAHVPVWVKQDSGPRPGLQGRIPDDLWALKAWPASAACAGSSVSSEVEQGGLF